MHVCLGLIFENIADHSAAVTDEPSPVKTPAILSIKIVGEATEKQNAIVPKHVIAPATTAPVVFIKKFLKRLTHIMKMMEKNTSDAKEMA